MWLHAQHDVPDRGDWYLMLLAALIDSLPARVWGKGGNRKLRPGEFRLNLTGGTEQPRQGPRTPEEAAVIAKAKWFGVLDLDPKTFRRAEDIPGYVVDRGE